MNIQDFYIELLISDLDDKGITYAPVRLTTFKNGMSNMFGSFDEKLTIKTNSAQDFTFSIWQTHGNKNNPYWPLLVNDRKLRLVIEGTKNYYMEFYIIDITPTIGTNNIKYTIKCQDAFSYDLTKQGINLTFSTNDEDIWGNETGPQSIVSLVNKVFELSHINNWIINPEINTYKISFVDNLYSSNDLLKVSLETTSTPYGILVEIAKLFNATISVDYMNKIIDFISNDTYQSKVYDLRPDYNLTSFSYGAKGDQLYNILHVKGAEDAYGNYISLMPNMPNSVRDFFLSDPKDWTKKTAKELYAMFLNENNINIYNDAEESKKFFIVLDRIKSASTFLYDFTYWKESGLISDNILQALEDDILEYRNLNLQYLCYSSLYYSLLNKYSNSVLEEEALNATIASDEEFLAYNEKPEKAEERLNYYQRTAIVEYNDKKYFKIYAIDIPDMFNNYTNLQFGEINGTNCRYFLPDFINFSDPKVTLMLPQNNYDRWQDVYYPNIPINYNYSNNTFDIDLSNVSNLELDNNQVKVDFVVLHDGSNIFSTFSQQVMDIDYVTQAKITDNMQQLFSLWNEDYVNNAILLYGKNIFDDKIVELRSKYFESYYKYQSLLQELLALTNKTTEAEAISQTVRSEMAATSIKFAAYTDIIQERTKLLTGIGGIGTRCETTTPIVRYREYRGYYDTYIDNLNLLITKRKNYINNYIMPEQYPNGLHSKIKDINKAQEEWKTNFYSKYLGLIRETEFTDSDQLDCDSLYAVAERQFYSYRKPGQSYSASYFSGDDLMQPLDDINIGDVVRINQIKLFHKNSKNTFMINVRKHLSPFKLNFLLNREVVVIERSGNKNIGFISEVCEDDIYYILTVKFTNEINYKTLVDWQIEGKSIFVDSMMPVPISDPVQLRITGITKSLRSSKIDLTVEQKNIVNFIIDRMLYSFK